MVKYFSQPHQALVVLFANAVNASNNLPKCMHTFGHKRGHSVNHLFLSRSELVLGLLESYSYKKDLPHILFCFKPSQGLLIPLDYPLFGISILFYTYTSWILSHLQLECIFLSYLNWKLSESLLFCLVSYAHNKCYGCKWIRECKKSLEVWFLS